MKKSFLISLAAGLTPTVIFTLIMIIECGGSSPNTRLCTDVALLQLGYVILLFISAIGFLFAHAVFFSHIKIKGIGLGLLVSSLIIIIGFFVYIINNPIWLGEWWRCPLWKGETRWGVKPRDKQRMVQGRQGGKRLQMKLSLRDAWILTQGFEGPL